MKSNKRVATFIGVLFLAGMIIGIAGNTLIQSILSKQDYLSTLSMSTIKIAMGSMLLLLTVAGEAAHGCYLGPCGIRYYSLWNCIGSPRLQPEFHAHNTWWFMGAFHRGLVDCKGIQFISNRCLICKDY